LTCPCAIDRTNGSRNESLWSPDGAEDALTGDQRYTVTAKDPQGRTGEFKPFEVQASQITTFPSGGLGARYMRLTTLPPVHAVDLLQR
jgi:hypothetical protein